MTASMTTTYFNGHQMSKNFRQVYATTGQFTMATISTTMALELEVEQPEWEEEIEDATEM